MSRTVTTLLAIIGSLLLLLSIYSQYLTLDYGDKQWEMLYARMWVEGKRLYADIFPVTPPLFFWIYGVPAALSRLPGFPGEFPLLLILGLGATAYSIFLSTCLMALHPGFAGRNMRLGFIALLCFVLIFRTNSNFFLDREYLFFMLVLPYMMRFSPSVASVPLPKSMRITIGILAGIGFCIKPHCLVVWASIQLLYMLQQKSLRILSCLENIIIYGIGLTYLLLVWLLNPEYYTTVVPMALESYSATRESTSPLDFLGNVLGIVIPALVMFRFSNRSPYHRDIFYLAGLIPFFVCYALINNNWAYTYYPLSCAALMLVGFLLWEFLYLRKERAVQHSRSWHFALGVCLCLAGFADKSYVELRNIRVILTDTCHHVVTCKGDDWFVEEVQSSPHPLSFGAISIDFTRWTRLSYFSGAAWVTRFPQLWMLPEFLITDEVYMLKHFWILNYVSDAFADDMDNRKPDVMFVDDTDVFYSAHGHVDLVEFFSVNPHFRDAWAHYHFQHNINLCNRRLNHRIRCSYEVYRRND